MCEPLTLAALAATAGGTVLQQMGRNEAVSAQDAAATQSIQRNSEYRRKADALFRDSLEKSGRDDFEARAAKAQEERARGLLPPEIVPPVQPRQGDSDTTAAAGAAEADKVKDILTTRGMARAKLGGDTDAFYQGARDILPNAEDIGFVARDIQAENELLPLRMADASRKGGGLREIGSIVSGLGTLGGLAAAGGQTFGTLGTKLSNGWDWLTGATKVAAPTAAADAAFMADKATLPARIT